MCILQLEIIRKQKIITSHTFDFYHCTSSSSHFTPNKNGTKYEILRNGRTENVDQPMEQLGLMIKLLYH